MNAEVDATPLASFEAKWSAAYPAFALAQRFVRDDREAKLAFACLVFEIEHAAFGIREAQPAAIKLQWWAEELMRAGRGEARHPLTQALGARIAASAVAPMLWQQAILAALSQRDPEPAADTAAWLDAYAPLYEPLGAAESTLFGSDAAATASALALMRALRETAALPVALRDGKMPLPLDRLARHRLSRGDLSNASPARADALREQLRDLADRLRALLARSALAAHPPGVIRATMAAADAVRAIRASNATEPLAALDEALGRLSIPAVWSAWRAARRSRA
ncbi:MAG: phytoene synthase [Rhodanobacteraceae bacterium]